MSEFLNWGEGSRALSNPYVSILSVRTLNLQGIEFVKKKLKISSHKHSELSHM